MWLFLFTELLLFGGMFLIYSIYRAKYAKEFHVAALELNGGIGTLNTLLLLTSSLTVALAIAAIRRGRKGACLVYLWATVAQGVGFMINKYFEWNYKFHHGFFPWKGTSKGLGKLLMEAKITEGESTFYNLYFVMTGLHGLHVLVGVVLLAVMVGFVMRDWVRKDDYGWLENSGLYWHLVDLIWIFLFPLFYLIS
ncbi:MAG: cytochrome c oxidase subunit 3 [Planctomycetes bacterium]|nr:cytochrome c oxidase subunit 3 [Planctomycetota bacterium]